MVEKEFLANDKFLDEVIDFVDAELENGDCNMKVVMQINIAVEEIFVNVCHYAYGNEEGKVNISVDKQDDTFSIKFKDSGIPFDPLAKLDPDISLGAEERQIGGLGIFMVKKTMDDVKYEYINNQNILTLYKRG